MEIPKGVLMDVGYCANLEDMIEDGHQYFKGGTNRPFPAWRSDSVTEMARFLVELGVRGGDPDVTDLTESQAYSMGERIMIEELGRGIVFGFPGVTVTA